MLTKNPFIHMLSHFQSMWDSHLRCLNDPKHRINLQQPDTATGYSEPYWAGSRTQEFEKVKMIKFLAENTIKPAQIEWAAPIKFVPRKGGGPLQFCVYHCKPNDVAGWDSFPISRMSKFIDFRCRATIFSTLDPNSGYGQIEIEGAYKAKTALTLQPS